MGFKSGGTDLSDLEVDSGTLSVDEAANRVGIGTITPDHDLEVESSAASKPVVNLKNTHDGATAASLRFTKDATAGETDALGTIDFYGENDNGTPESIQYASITAGSTDTSDGSESGTVEFKATVDGTLVTNATMNPESSTGDTFCGGFGTRCPTMLGVNATTLTPAQSGCNVLMTPGVGVKLPTPSAGLWYRFINVAGTGSGAAMITSTTNGTTAEELFFGVLRDTDSFTSGGNADVLTFTTSSTEGDYIEVYCVSATITGDNNTWWYKAVGAVDGSITAT